MFATPLQGGSKKKCIEKVYKFDISFEQKMLLKETLHRSVSILVSYILYFIQFFPSSTFPDTFKFILISKSIKNSKNRGKNIRSMWCDAYAQECMGTDVVMGSEYFDKKCIKNKIKNIVSISLYYISTSVCISLLVPSILCKYMCC